MKAMAMTARTIMVNISGKRFILLSCHSAMNSLLWFFFIIMARRKGDMTNTVRRPHMPFAHQCMPGIIFLMNGRKNVNMSTMHAVESMEYTRVLSAICVMSFFQLLSCTGALFIDTLLSDFIQLFGRWRST